MARPLASLAGVLSNLEALRARAAEMEREEAELVRDLTALRSARAAILGAIEMLETRERLSSAPYSDTMGTMNASPDAPDSKFRHHRGRRPKGGGPADDASEATGLSMRQIAAKIGLSYDALKKGNRREADGEGELSPAVKAALKSLIAEEKKKKRK